MDVSGVTGGAPAGSHSPVFLQVFQCWGGLKADGSPDPSAADPDPATCQVGAGDAGANTSWSVRYSRMVTGDELLANGDWTSYLDTLIPDNDVPFTAISGKKWQHSRQQERVLQLDDLQRGVPAAGRGQRRCVASVRGCRPRSSHRASAAAFATALRAPRPAGSSSCRGSKVSSTTPGRSRRRSGRSGSRSSSSSATSSRAVPAAATGSSPPALSAYPSGSLVDPRPVRPEEHRDGVQSARGRGRARAAS